MIQEISLKESQQISLQILVEIDSICRTLNLKYCLIYGTLIGAIRHNGFIPWDDDIDIMMPRDDYEKLLSYFHNNKTNLYPYELFSPFQNPDYPFMISRISDSRYIIKTENEKDYGLGAFVDIYPFDGLGNSYKDSLNHAIRGDRLSSLCYRSTRLKPIRKINMSFKSKIIEEFSFVIAKLIGKKYFMKKLDSLSKKYDYEDSKYIGCVTWLSGGAKDMFCKSDFETLIEHEFENHYFFIPKEYDTILKHIYGDYMKLPPKRERVGHHFYKIYKKDTKK